jgi:ATP-dependent DNA helicase RecQ
LSPLDILRGTFGYESFRPGQEKVIQAVLAGRDCIAVMPTGAGKSLTFQIPAKILGGVTLVISPLIALMKDQVDGVLRKGFRATVINSSVPFEERRRRLGGFRRGEWEMVYLAPEALEGSLREFIQDCPIALVVVDEAHCISAWGHDFRPAYRKLSGLKSQLGDVPILALTATATRKVAADILRQLGMVKPEGFKGSFYRPNLRILCQKKGDGRDLRRELADTLRRRPGESGIIYCTTRKSVESLVEYLRGKGVVAAAYHAGMTDADRARAQDNFLSGKTPVAVATIAFGMGIDKPDVRFVVHRDMPKSIESYVQEIGRAGRDGKPSDCLLFYSWADVVAFDRFPRDGGDPSAAAEMRRKAREMYQWADRKTCRHRSLAAHFDEEMADCGGPCDACSGASWDGLRAALSLPARSAKEIVPARSRRRSPGPAPSGDLVFERLRSLRRELADAKGMPAFRVFPDSTLRHMVDMKPDSLEALRRVPGVGPVKWAQYGEPFFRALQETGGMNFL